MNSGQKIGHWTVDSGQKIGHWAVDNLFSFYKLRIYYFHENIQILIKFYYVL